MNPELLARWTKTRPLVQLAGVASVLLTLCLLLLGMRFVIAAWPLPVKPAIVGFFLFAAALTLTPAIHLLRQAAAIRRAARTKSEAAFAEVLLYQHRYWSFLGTLLVILLLLSGLLHATAAVL